MKKKILSGVFALAIAATAAFNFNMNTENHDLSMLNLANVEALAQGESAGEYYIYHREDGTGYNCWKGGSETC